MQGDIFLKFFPVPSYLEFPAVGIDVSDSSVKFIELLSGERSVTLGRFGVRPFSDNLATVLSSVRKECGFSMVNASIPEGESYFIRMRLPFMKIEEIRDAVELQLEGHIPYPASEVEFDYQVLKTDPRANDTDGQARQSGHIDVNVAVLPKKIVGQYLSVFKEANLCLTMLMTEPEATLRAAMPKGERGVAMIVNFGRKATALSIVAGGAVWFSYTFNLGGDDLAKRLGESCSVSGADAEKLKDEVGLTDEQGSRKIFECLLPMVSGLRDEISKHRQYWSLHKKDFLIAEDVGDISKLIICGSQAAIPGLVDYLSETLNIEVVLPNPWVNCFNFDQYIPPISRNDSMEYVTAIGLALSSLK